MTQPGLIVSAIRSGAGKTTVALGLMRALARRGTSVQPYKCGPDYIDPAFHAAAAGRPSYNLDTWAMPRGLIARSVQEAAAPSDSLFPEPGGTPQDHARLLELLTARLGAENVLVPAPMADYRPEPAARWVPMRDAPKPAPLRASRPAG